MDQYSMVMNTIKKLLTDIGKEKYAAVVGDCIDSWQKNGDCTRFQREFDKNGRFRDFRLDGRDISDPEKGLWIGQLFSALIALSAQIANDLVHQQPVDMDFLRRNFGASNEIMTTARCSSCNAREASASDVDRYISKIVIPKVLIGGLEREALEEAADSIMNLTSPEIRRERKKAVIRLENSRIPYVDTYGREKSCLKCGSKNITEGKLLRSVKENIFIPLNS